MAFDVLTEEQPRRVIYGLADPADQESSVLADLDLHPAPRLSRVIWAGSILGDEALVAAVLHKLPRLEAIGSETPHGEDQPRALDRRVKGATAVAQGSRTEVPIPDPEAVEGHE